MKSTKVPKVRLITFGGGSTDFLEAVDRLRIQCKSLPLIDEFVGYSPNDLPAKVCATFIDKEFSELRGFGYWRWKSWIVKDAVSKLNDDDVLIYLDAGAEINEGGKDRFTQYLDLVAQHGYIFFSMPYQHRHWTKVDPLLSVSEQHFFRNQISAGCFIIKISQASRDFVAEWDRRCSIDNGRLLMDEPELLLNGAIDHRHDQAVLSRLIFDSNLPTISPDETFFSPWPTGKDYPFLLLRNRTGVSRLKYSLASRPKRFSLYLVAPFIDRKFAKRRVAYYLSQITSRLKKK